MTMDKRAPVESEIKAAFEQVIEYPHMGVPTDAGFDTETYLALVAYAQDPSERLAGVARNELRKQLNGTHASEDDDLWAAAIRGARG